MTAIMTYFLNTYKITGVYDEGHIPIDDYMFGESDSEYEYEDEIQKLEYISKDIKDFLDSNNCIKIENIEFLFPMHKEYDHITSKGTGWYKEICIKAQKLDDNHVLVIQQLKINSIENELNKFKLDSSSIIVPDMKNKYNKCAMIQKELENIRSQISILETKYKELGIEYENINKQMFEKINIQEAEFNIKHKDEIDGLKADLKIQTEILNNMIL